MRMRTLFTALLLTSAMSFVFCTMVQMALFYHDLFPILALPLFTICVLLAVLWRILVTPMMTKEAAIQHMMNQLVSLGCYIWAEYDPQKQRSIIHVDEGVQDLGNR